MIEISLEDCLQNLGKTKHYWLSWFIAEGFARRNSFGFLEATEKAEKVQLAECVQRKPNFLVYSTNKLIEIDFILEDYLPRKTFKSRTALKNLVPVKSQPRLQRALEQLYCFKYNSPYYGAMKKGYIRRASGFAKYLWFKKAVLIKIKTTYESMRKKKED